MSGSVRKRKSKWDLKEESEFAKISSNNIRVDDSNLDDWPNFEANNGLKSNDKFELGSWEPLSGNGGAHKDVHDKRDFNEISQNARGWAADDSYNMRTSPGFGGRVPKRYGRSPRNNWRQSNRGRSRSRSQGRSNTRGRSVSRSRSKSRSRSQSQSRSWSHSRSRSRSPHVDFRRDSYGFNERSRNGSGVSSQRCRDFVSGRCSRGSQCRFLHQDNLNYRDGGRSEIDKTESWERQEHRRASRYANTEEPMDYQQDKVTHGGYGNQYDGENDVLMRNNSRSSIRCNDFLKGKCNRGSSCKFSHHGASGDRYDRNDWDHERKREPHRVGAIQCKYFAMGKCFNGDRCRFSHDDPPCSNSEGRSRDGRWGHNLDDEHKSWEDTKWSGAAGASDISKSSEWVNHDKGNKSFTDSVVADKSVGDSWGQNLGNENKPWAASASKDKACETDAWGSSHWGAGSNVANLGIPELMSGAKLSVKEDPLLTPVGSQAQILNGISRPSHEQNIMLEASSLQLATSIMQSTVSADSYVHQHLSKSGDNAAMVDSSSHDRVNFSLRTLHLPGQSFNKDGDNLGSQPLLSFNETSQSQHMHSLNPLNGPGQQINSPLNLQSQTQFCHSESVGTPQMTEVPQVASGTPRNFVTNNPVDHMSSISESLAQVFGNGQQLLQPYALLKTPNSIDLLPSHSNTAGLVPSAASITVQPNATPYFKEQYQTESIESCKPESSSQLNGYLLNPNEQKNLVPSQGFSLSMMSAAGANSAEMNKIGNSAGESPKMKQQEPVANSEVKGNNREVAEECKQEPENLDMDGRADEGNRIKDEKGMRMFKNALVEFVKEILKPTWKEGQMSREVHKTIVKKVVDKVTGSIQGEHVPKTQEKIDHYLSYCKPKLTKLVQAYVEKFLKS